MLARRRHRTAPEAASEYEGSWLRPPPGRIKSWLHPPPRTFSDFWLHQFSAESLSRALASSARGHHWRPAARQFGSRPPRCDGRRGRADGLKAAAARTISMAAPNCHARGSNPFAPSRKSTDVESMTAGQDPAALESPRLSRADCGELAAASRSADPISRSTRTPRSGKIWM